MGPWAFAVPFTLVSALGLLVNAYVLLVVLGLGKQTQQQQSANTLLLIHLGAVEFVVCFVLLICTTGPWTAASDAWCYVHGFLLTLLHPIALWTVTGLNCDRYYAIAAPLHYTAVVSPRRVIAGLIASWTGSLILCLPPFSGLVPPYKYSDDLGCCVPDFGNNTWGLAGLLYASIYVVVGLAVPAALVTVCNLRVLGIARYHRHRIASAIYEVTLSAQVTITHQRNPFFVPSVTAPSAGGPPRFHSAASTVMQLVGSLYLLYFPYCGLILWEACNASTHGRLNAPPRLASLASLLLASSPPINGLLYGLKSRTLRRTVQNYWRKKVTKSELQQEIQARTPSVAGSRRPSGSGPVSLFPFPPLQRRLSEALLNLGTNSRNICGAFESGNTGTFSRGRLQPAASCNTLRVPTNESGERTSKIVRTSASTSSLMGYRNEFASTTTESINVGSDNTTDFCSKRSPRILITRTYSVESPGGGSPLLKKSGAITGKAGGKTNEKKRWRHISTGSDSSTGSSDASVWTTGIIQRGAKGGFKNSMDNWPAGKCFTHVRTLGEGAQMFASIRGSNNSESSDTTDTTATTTTSTLPLKIPTMTGELKELPDEKMSTENEKDGDECDRSESSWSSIDEEENGGTPSSIESVMVEGEKYHSGPDNQIVCKMESPKLLKKYRKRRKEKSRVNSIKIIRDEKNIPRHHEGTSQLRPLLTPSS